MAEHAPTTIDAVETSLAIVNLLHERDSLGISELADELSIAKSTAHRHVTTLEEHEMVCSNGREIRLGTEYLRLGNGVRYREPVSEIVEEIVENLSEETAERANFFVEEFGYSVCLHRKIGERGIVAETEIGKRFLMHSTAAGKAMLSMMPEHETQTVIDQHGLPRQTDNTITSVKALMAELETIREEGIAFNDEENIEDLRSIGVPVKVGDRELPGAITISGPAHRLSDDRINDELSEALLAASNELELKRKY